MKQAAAVVMQGGETLSSNDVVDQYPRPPSYYTLWTDDAVQTGIEPPEIPIDPTPPYGGTVFTPKLMISNGNEDYKTELKR